MTRLVNFLIVSARGAYGGCAKRVGNGGESIYFQHRLKVSGVPVSKSPAYLQQLYSCSENIVFRYIIQSFILKVLQNIFPWYLSYTVNCHL